MATQASLLTLKTVIGSYPYHDALKDEALELPNARLEIVDVPLIGAFRRMARDLEFDVCELGIGPYLGARAFGKPLTAIPVFPNRNFVHDSVVVNVNAGIEKPKDLEGKRVGGRSYMVGASVWARGILASEYGVDLDKVTWVMADDEHIVEFQKNPPSNLIWEPGADIAKMLEEGKIDAAIGIGRIDSNNVRPLFPEAREAVVEYYRRTGIYPPTHVLAVKEVLLDENPWLAQVLFDAFTRSKALWLEKASEEERLAISGGVVQGDPRPFGIESNRDAIEAMIIAADRQKIMHLCEAEDLFHASARHLS